MDEQDMIDAIEMLHELVDNEKHKLYLVSTKTNSSISDIRYQAGRAVGVQFAAIKLEEFRKGILDNG